LVYFFGRCNPFMHISALKWCSGFFPIWCSSYHLKSFSQVKICFSTWWGVCGNFVANFVGKLLQSWWWWNNGSTDEPLPQNLLKNTWKKQSWEEGIIYRLIRTQNRALMPSRWTFFWIFCTLISNIAIGGRGLWKNIVKLS